MESYLLAHCSKTRNDQGWTVGKLAVRNSIQASHMDDSKLNHWVIPVTPQHPYRHEAGTGARAGAPLSYLMRESSLVPQPLGSSSTPEIFSNARTLSIGPCRFWDTFCGESWNEEDRKEMLFLFLCSYLFPRSPSGGLVLSCQAAGSPVYSKVPR